MSGFCENANEAGAVNQQGFVSLNTQTKNDNDFVLLNLNLI